MARLVSCCSLPTTIPLLTIGLDGSDGDTGDLPPADGSAPSASDLRAGGGKYVPPSMRAGAKGAGESMHQKNRDDLPTLRVTNLSEDATEDDMWTLFERFGKISRVYVGKDQETGLCKGFAFVSFESRQDAQKAVDKVHNLPYDHLILGCQFSGEFCILLLTQPEC